METYVEFRSTSFSSLEQLVDVLTNRLTQQGVSVLQPGEEDWGWMIPVANREFSLWIGCGKYEEYDDGYLCFIEPNKPLVRKFFFKKISTEKSVNFVRASLDCILQEGSEFKDVKWWTGDDFNNPDSDAGDL